MKKLFWTLAVLAGGLALAASPARAQTICTGTLAAGTYTNVSVPKNAYCALSSGVMVTGNVTVASGAYLATEDATVDGSVLSNDAVDVFVGTGAYVGTNVSLVGTTDEAVVVDSIIGGNLQITGGSGFVGVANSTVTGNVLVVSNSTTGALSDVIGANTIGGNLTCVGNAPPPSNEGFPNTVSGHEVGQCAGL